MASLGIRPASQEDDHARQKAKALVDGHARTVGDDSFVMATAALAMDIEVLMGFQGNGAFLAMKGMADHVAAPGFAPLKELLKIYTDTGGKMYVCGPCVGSHNFPA